MQLILQNNKNKSIKYCTKYYKNMVVNNICELLINNKIAK